MEKCLFRRFAEYVGYLEIKFSTGVVRRSPVDCFAHVVTLMVSDNALWSTVCALVPI